MIIKRSEAKIDTIYVDKKTAEKDIEEKVSEVKTKVKEEKSKGKSDKL